MRQKDRAADFEHGRIGFLLLVGFEFVESKRLNQLNNVEAYRYDTR